jgi:hypothetical protein
MRRTIVLLLAVTLVAISGCAVTGKSTRERLDPVHRLQAEDAWRRFRNASHNAEAQAGPFRLNANLHYAGDEGTQRVGVYFWGNGGIDPYPLRLDIQAGMGGIMAAVREDAAYFAAYVPGDAALYLYPQGRDGMQAFDVPIPFSLADLALLFNGRYGALFIGDGGEEGTPPVYAGNAGAFLFVPPDARLPGSLELGLDGLPVFWTEEGDEGWTVRIEYRADSTRTTPYRVRFTHAGGRRATVVVRELARPAAFAARQLDLAYPQGTAVRLLQPR